MDNLIISGLSVQYRTYARTASNLPMDKYAVQEAGTLEENVLAFLNNHNIPIKKSDVSICHTLKSKGKNSLILLKCSNIKAKLDMVKNAKKLRGSNVCINEDLTKRISDLADRAVMMKTKAATLTVNILKSMMKITFTQLDYQCGSNLCHNISNNIYLVFLNAHQFLAH